MGESVLTIGTKEIFKEEPSNIPDQKVQDVHIRVFFDGTNNNAVQLALHDNIKIKYNEIDKDTKITKDAAAIKKEYEEKKLELSLLTSNSTYDPYGLSYSINASKIESLQKEISQKEKELREINLHPDLDVDKMHKSLTNGSRGYSNVAILYSLLSKKTDTDKDIYYDLYVEGSGATDITQYSDKNPNGLGFGLGLTGVTALVSKAVDSIYHYLVKRVIRFDENTKYHFYVFGFSRGSTCARLFAHLATRDTGDKIERESEFGLSTSFAKGRMVDGRLPFMEERFLGKTLIIKRDNVTVDILGIYDTVASIGFLQQRDGWVNKLSWFYRFPPRFNNNYRNNFHYFQHKEKNVYYKDNNFHYKNSREYGLYSPKNNKRIQKVFQICAADEFRENFALVNLGKHIDETRHLEIVIPGCHSDIGGGYIDEVSMDCVVAKRHPRTYKALATLPLNNPLLSVDIDGDNDTDKKIKTEETLAKSHDVGYLNEDTLSKLGWIDTKDKDNPAKVEIEGHKYKDKKFTVRYVEGEHNVHFMRRVLAGYSNIPLAMMLKFVEKQCASDEELFNSTENPYDYTKISGLKKFGDKLVSISGEVGKRYWVIPENDNSGKFYKWLRLRYLHFTSSKSLVHFRKTTEEEKEEKGSVELETNFGNLGNPINYADSGRICRIMYDGEKDLEKGEYKTNVKYMPSMESVEIIAYPSPSVNE